jgi:aspartyl-tRNA(Asn)/glutamyl-tRNA(Gln) amidotransferase subunit A
MNDLDVAYTPAVKLREQYASGDLSPVEVTEATLRRIDRLNPMINAFITVTHDLAMDQARQAEKAFQSGDGAGPLCGVPVSIKDLMATKGVRTTLGSLLHENWIPDFDAPLVERLIDAGAVIVGKTNTPERGWKGDSTNRIVGSTHNPWKQGRTPGGSSGGAGAAATLGMGPLAMGSDGAGSIRIPAGFCGIVGFKSSFGLVPQYPPSPVELLSHAGPMTRTVADAALMLSVIAGADARDRLSISASENLTKSLDGGVRGLRVAWSADLGFAEVDPEVRNVFVKAMRHFEELGCSVTEAHPLLEDPWPAIVRPIWTAAFAAAYSERSSEELDRIDTGLIPVIEDGRRMTGVDVAKAHIGRNEYYHGWREFMDDYDLMVTPTLPVTAFKAGDDHPGQINGKPTTFLGWTAFTYPFNVTGQPAITLPCGFSDDGLPIGLQIVGRWRQDATVLRAAAAFEQAAPWGEKRPPEEA